MYFEGRRIRMAVKQMSSRQTERIQLAPKGDSNGNGEVAGSGGWRSIDEARYRSIQSNVQYCWVSGLSGREYGKAPPRCRRVSQSERLMRPASCKQLNIFLCICFPRLILT